ncbi:glutathione S-transferase family protein [Chelatococcus asaccharovorans]|uniref:glutathione S-transferase family protein n=1 Tax=Chelatococcus asaccharovorans TaxID=28210 RepID=UPI00224C73B5|nr:glutathione S-transferase N-terminal domain-containing protein [Chelatococcus asaccharovorans]CAH1649673.1 Glutathione S-transferase family protein [Chelatococcus asaccharovorans]CAH1691742.1 Glutathione S-transferase family protein [Chelatococcus asaccharovorans]
MAQQQGDAEEKPTMRLFWSSRSPFVRKVMVTAHELGLTSQIATQRVAVGIVRLDDDLMAANPLNKIPTLVTREGEALFDSRVICAYLDSIADEPRLFPLDKDRWQSLRMQALADGMMDLLTLRLFENIRPEGKQWDAVHDAARTKIAAVCDHADARIAQEDGPIHIGHIALACALAHCDFRFGADGWRIGRPALAAWYETIRSRPSMVATAYEDVY